MRKTNHGFEQATRQNGSREALSAVTFSPDCAKKVLRLDWGTFNKDVWIMQRCTLCGERLRLESS